MSYQDTHDVIVESEIEVNEVVDFPENSGEYLTEAEALVALAERDWDEWAKGLGNGRLDPHYFEEGESSEAVAFEGSCVEFETQLIESNRWYENQVDDA